MRHEPNPAPRALRDPASVSRPGITADSITRACFAAFAAKANPITNGSSEDVAAALWPSDPVSRAVTRASVTPGATGDHGALIGASVAAFLASLPQSAGASLVARSLSVQLARNGSVLVPFDAAGEIAPPWVGEEAPIPVNTGASGAVTIGPARKLGVILALTRELAKQPGAEALFRLMLQRRAAAAFDAALFASTAGDAESVAGLLHGVAPIDAIAGDLAGALAELAGALGAVGGSGQVVIATDPGTAARIALRLPLLSWPVLASSQLPAGRIVAIDPAGLVFGTGGDLDILAANAALLHMSDEPGHIVADATTADPVREVFQTSGIALRLLMDLAFAARPGAVQFVDGGQWG